MKIILIAFSLLFGPAAMAVSHGNSSTVAVSQAGNLIIAANKSRSKLIIQNINGAGNVAVKLDSLPGDDDDGHILATREVIILEVSNAVYGKASQVAGDTISIIEILE